jgi:hypothetical protein
MSDNPTPEEVRLLFDQGRAACSRALTLHDNPHPPGTIRRRKMAARILRTAALAMNFATAAADLHRQES